ncbi:MAG: 50S ribosomal protein L5 [bacterium]|nr:50S ribosomal protein L5 [bacterium]
MLRFKEKYNKEIIPAMMEKFGYKNRMAVPQIEKVVVNSGFGRLIVALAGDEQKKTIQNFIDDISLICGQKPVLTKAKKSIASFKLRQGLVIGVKATLRGPKMEDFIDRLVGFVLPRTRDFKGLDPKSVSQQGDLSIGFKEQIAFPEISQENIKRIFGLEVVIHTTAKNKEEGIGLLKLLGFPFKA